MEIMDEESMQAKIEKWVEATPPMKRSVILLPIVILLSLFLVWYWDWANLSLEKMLGPFIMNVIVFFFIIVPLTSVLKKRNHAKWGIDVILGSVIDGWHYNGYIVTYPSIWVSTLDRLWYDLSTTGCTYTPSLHMSIVGVRNNHSHNYLVYCFAIW